MVTITVFTAVYNRKDKIKKLYESLRRQNDKDFEWLIVDDGSTDNLGEEVEAWKQASNPFVINYIWKENGGKHTAINVGAKVANGKYFFICDSDDYLTDDAISKLLMWDKSTNDMELAGLCGQRMNYTGEYLLWHEENGVTYRYGGKPLFDKYIDANMYDAIHTYGLRGDRAEAIKTEVLRRYPFPEYKGERFCPEAVIYNQMAKDNLLFRWFDEPLIIGEYEDSGMTNNILKWLMASPRGWADDIKNCLEEDAYIMAKMEEYYVYMRKELSLEQIAEYLEIDNCDELVKIRKDNLSTIEEIFTLLTTVENKITHVMNDVDTYNMLLKLQDQAKGMLIGIDYNYYKLWKEEGLESAKGRLAEEKAFGV